MQKLIIPIVLLIVSAITLTSCSADTAGAQEKAAAVPATVAKPVVRTVAVTQTYPAQVEAIERVELRPQVAGYLDSVNFAEGAKVAKGQVLFRIDPRPFAAALAEAEAALAQAEADAQALQREGERATRLVERKAISQEDAERRRATASVGTARVAAAKAAVERARLQLAFTEIKSPIGGRIGRAEATRGNLVSPETRLAVIVSTNPVYVRFDVDEATLVQHLGNGSRWRVHFSQQGSNAILPAEVAFVENEIGGGTGTLRVRAKLANPAGLILPGMFGTATLTLAENKNAVLVREEAIGADQGQRFVLVAGKDDVLQYRPVTLGAREGDLRVITNGLGAGDRIVVNGLFRLRPGTPIAPNVVAMEKGSAS